MRRWHGCHSRVMAHASGSIPDPPLPHTPAMTSWFRTLTGFDERDYADTQSLLRVVGDRLHSLVNGGSWGIGHLETPSLAELRARVAALPAPVGAGVRVRNVVADAYALHLQPAVRGALVQVASQFNLLEMASPGATPELGVGIYDFDPTQGPACARAAGAATVYRNYFVPVRGQLGQTRDRQLNMLADLCAVLPGGEGIVMQNGYALTDAASLRRIRSALRACSEAERDALRQRLRIGLLWDAQVTAPGAAPEQRVCQAFCSALPVSYNVEQDPALWREFALLVLEAAYEATLLAGVLNAARPGGSRSVYLTLVGGGAFGNERAWILAAMERALGVVERSDLQISVVSFGKVPNSLRSLERDEV